MSWSKKQLSTLITVSITSFMGTFLISSINIALPAIEQSFGLNAISLSWVITAFLVATGIFLLPVGKWGDISGNVRLFKAGLIVFTLASVLCAVSPSGVWLIVARFVQGVGSAFTNTTGQAILVTNFPARNRGQVIGISVASVYAGLATGPFIGGFLTQSLGWHSLFYVAAILGVLSTIIAFAFLEKDTHVPSGDKKVNLRGTLFFVIGLVGLVYGSSHIPSAYGWGLMIFGIVMLVLFWIIESRLANPMFETRLFTHNKLFGFSNLAALINYTATSAIVFFLSLYLQKIQGLPPREAGAVIIAQPVMMAIFSPVVGRLSDRIQPRYFATLGMAMCSIGLFAMSFFTSSTPLWIIILVLVWEGLGFAFFSSPNMNTIMSSVDKSRYGQASGTASSMRIFGQIVGMTIVTFFFAFHFGSKAVTEVNDTIFLIAMKWGFVTFALISVVGIYFSFTRGNVERK
ncbi:MFS transporter [Petrimonas sp.]|uniref:MFS transporter n=1 Tax=Petrimonas sp. TaxID=2023866 RepID=UPI003F51A1FF